MLKRLLLTLYFTTIFIGLFANVIVGNKAYQTIKGAELVRMDENLSFPKFIKFRSDYNLEYDQFDLWLKKTFKLRPEDHFQLYKTYDDQIGFTHHRYQQYYKGLEVFGGVLIVHVKGNKIVSINGEFFDNIDLNVNAAIKEQDALQNALLNVNAQSYMWQHPHEEDLLKQMLQDPNATYYPNSEMVIVPKDLQWYEGDFRTTYKFDVYAHDPISRQNVYVDISDGSIVANESRLYHADSSCRAVTMYSDTQDITADQFGIDSFRLRETGRGGGIETYDMNQGTNYGNAVDFFHSDPLWDTTNVNEDEAAHDAHWGAEMTYDYFNVMHGRNSFDDAGGKILSYIHYSSNYVNAFWDGIRMTYGDGNGTTFGPLTSIDVVGHEIAHGVTTNSSNLVYQAESGALNESFSDIFGTTVEEYGVDSADFDWLIGEDFDYTSDGFRNMMDPNADGDPDTYFGTNWKSLTGGDNGGVHSNSGVQNFWFYLLSVGGTGTNDNSDVYSVTGVTIDTAGAIAYRNNNVYLSVNSQFADARFYAIQSAIDLYGACSRYVESTTNAWYAVGVGDEYQDTVIASWNQSIDSACSAPYTVDFVNTSLNATSFNWTFGDGNSSILANPSNTYNALGSYDVQLIADGGDCGIDTTLITSAVVLDTSVPCVVILPSGGTVPIQTACEGTVFDDGGALGDYSAGHRTSVTISPTGAGTVTLTFDTFGYEIGWDSVTIFDGANTSSPIIGSYDGFALPNGGTITSSGPSITIEHFSDAFVEELGFEVRWQCNEPDTPVADFIVDIDSFCSGSGTVQFTDLSTNAPTSWNWDFGDGNTSTIQDPVHTYTSSGTFDVSLIAANAIGIDTVTKFGYIFIDTVSSPSAQGDTIVCIGDSVDLIASNSGYTQVWFDQAIDGEIIHCGDTFNTSIINATDTFFVASSNGTLGNVGAFDNNIGGGGNFGTATQHLIFDALQPFTLVSVKVFASGTALRTIELRDDLGNVVETATISIPDGESRVTLNFDVPVGNNFELGGNGTMNLYRNNTGANYPYVYPGVVKIKNSSFSPNYYYFYYDWEIEEKISCTSNRKTIIVNAKDVPNSPLAIIGDSMPCTSGIDTFAFAGADSNAWGHVWLNPFSTSITDTTDTLKVTLVSVGQNTISVYAFNNCGNSDTLVQALKSTTDPLVPSMIYGNFTPCEGTVDTYYVDQDTNVASYNWYLPSSWSGTSNSDTIYAGVTSESGQIYVEAVNKCGSSDSVSFLVTVDTIPPVPSNPVYDSTVCDSSLQTITVDATNPAPFYSWSHPSEWFYSGSGFKNLNSESFEINAVDGTLKIVALNSCGISDGDTLRLNFYIESGPSLTGPVIGDTTPCMGDTMVLSVAGYSANTDRIIWSVPILYAIDTFEKFDSMLVYNMNVTGTDTVYVSAVNECGSSDTLLTRVKNTSSTFLGATVQGPFNPCESSSQTYYLDYSPFSGDSNVTSYTWNLPSGWTGSSSTDTINVVTSATPGIVEVVASNKCGSLNYQYNVTIDSIPNTPVYVTGDTNVCDSTVELFNVVSQTTGVTPIYTWIVPNEWTMQSASPISDFEAILFEDVSGVIKVSAYSSCGSSDTLSINVSLDSVPDLVCPVSGNTTPCENATETYSVSAASGSTIINGYTWILPSGMTGSSNADTIDVNVGTTSGDIKVVAYNDCGSSDTCSISISTISSLSSPGTISGIDTICSGVAFSYSVSAVSGASSYLWTLPSGWTGSSTTNSITVTNNGTSGQLSVEALSSCDTSASSVIAIAIRDINDGVSCTNDSCDIATGLAINTPDNSLCDDLDPCNGVETCDAITGCVPGTPPAVPSTPGTISGSNSVCVGSNETYSISPVANATFYIWTTPSGWTGSSTDTSITVSVGNSSGTISVAAANNCDTSATSILTITTDSIPGVPGVITGDTTPCFGTIQNYSIAAVPGASSYTWTYTGSWSGSNSSNSISATINSSGVINVSASNVCGSSSSASLSINMDSLPIANFSYADTGLKATFTNLSVSGTSFSWDYGNGVISSATDSCMTYATQGKYEVCLTAVNACGSDVYCDSVEVFDPSSNFVWTGTTSSDWNLASNWNLNTVPGCNDAALIPFVPNLPVILTGTFQIGDLTLDPLATIDIQSGATLELCSHITNNGTNNFGIGTMSFIGTSLQNVIGSIRIGNLTVNNSFGVLQISGSQMEVTGIVDLTTGSWDVNGNSFTLISESANTSGQIEGGGSGQIIGQIAMQRFVPNTYSGSLDTAGYETGYHNLSSPLDNVLVTDFGDNWSWSTPGGYPAFNLVDYTAGTYFSFGTFYQYDEAATNPGAPFGPPYNYERWIAPTTAVAPMGMGYAAHLPQTTTIEVSGTYNHTSSPTINLTKSGSTSFDGWSLIGNPFPSGYDWSSAVRTNVDAAIYWWDPLLMQYVSSIGGGSGSSPLKSNIGALQSPASPNGNVVLPMQGFMVIANTNPASVQFNNTGRTTSGGTFYRSGLNEVPQFRLSVTNDQAHEDQALFYFNDNATKSYDGEYDAFKMLSPNSKVPTLYSIASNGKPLSINALAESTNDEVIPLGFEAKSNGTFTIELNELEALPESKLIYLEDRTIGSFTNLRMSEHTFNWLTSENEEGRFYLHIYPAIEFSFDKESCNGGDASLYLDQHGIIVWDEISIFDSEGNLVHSKIGFNGKISIQDLNEGTYTIIAKIGSYEANEEFYVDGDKPVIADFVSDTYTKKVGEEFNFINTSFNGIDADWELGDGTFITNIPNLDYAYTTPGNYNVRMISYNDNCQDDIIKNVVVTSKSTSVQELNDLGINVYSSQSTVYLETDRLIDQLLIHSTNGKLLLNESMIEENRNYDLSSYAKATYFITLKVEDEWLDKKVILTD